MPMGPAIYDFNFIFHDVGGNEVNFEPSDEDTSNATYKYYGYLSSFGSWIILRFDVSVTDVINYRYATGKSAYSTNWTNKASLTYNYFNAITPV